MSSSQATPGDSVRAKGSTSMPTLRGTDHIGLTVPNLDEAIEFFTEIIGCQVVHRMGPFVDDEGTWFTDELGLHPRSRCRMAMLRCGTGVNLEVFEYESPNQRQVVPKMSDWGGHHLAFYVDDIDEAVKHLTAKGLEIHGESKPAMGPEAGEGTGWIHFSSPWGLACELVSFPNGKAYEAETDLRLWSPTNPTVPVRV